MGVKVKRPSESDQFNRIKIPAFKGQRATDRGKPVFFIASLIYLLTNELEKTNIIT